MDQYIAYFIDYSFSERPYQVTTGPVKLMETFSSEQQAWNKIGQILLIDYAYIDTVIDDIKSNKDNEMKRNMEIKIPEFRKFLKDNRGKFSDGQFQTLFMRKIMDCPEMISFMKEQIEKDTDLEYIFGVKQL